MNFYSFISIYVRGRGCHREYVLKRHCLTFLNQLITYAFKFLWKFSHLIFKNSDEVDFSLREKFILLSYFK